MLIRGDFSTVSVASLSAGITHSVVLADGISGAYSFGFNGLPSSAKQTLLLISVLGQESGALLSGIP